jgi:hypothetical protein
MPVSWQLEQPAVTPAWICGPVGAGVAKAVPGAVRVAVAGTGPFGVLPRWQDSQLVDEGMWDPVPAGEVGGMPTRAAMPAKLAVWPAGRWQAAQLLVMPLWLIVEPLKRAPFGTGSAAMLEPLPTWQVSQEALVGMWLPGWPTMAKLAEGIAKLAAALPWHWTQLPVVLGALAWMAASVGISE